MLEKLTEMLATLPTQEGFLNSVPPMAHQDDKEGELFIPMTILWNMHAFVLRSTKVGQTIANNTFLLEIRKLMMGMKVNHHF